MKNRRFPKAATFVLLLNLLLPLPILAAEDLMNWISEHEATALSKQTGKPILFYFMLNWGDYSKRMTKDLFNDPQYADWIKQEFLTVRLKDERREKGFNEYSVDYLRKKYSIRTYPTLVVDVPHETFFYTSHRQMLVGYWNPNKTRQFLQASLDILKPGTKPGSGKEIKPGWILVKGWGQPHPGEGFNLYYSATSGKGYKKANAEPITGTSFALNNLEAEVRYHFVLTWLKPEGGKLVESIPSQEFTTVAQPGSAPVPKANPVAFYSRSMAANNAAIAAGITAGMVVMGDRYLSGNGVPKNLDYAKRWYKKAVGLGDSVAKDRLESADRLAAAWFDKKHSLSPIFSDFNRADGGSNWGMPWGNFQDPGDCGTKTFFPPPGKPPVDFLPAPQGGSELAGHFAGHLGAQTEPCKIFSWATIQCDFLPGCMPIDFSAAGLPNTGFHCQMRLGRRHPEDKQDYIIYLHKFSITPEMSKNKGQDFLLVVLGKNLSKTEWTQVRVDFPKTGTTSVQPSKTFGQPDWIGQENIVPWDSSDLFRIDISPMNHGQDFDFYVKDIGFY